MIQHFPKDVVRDARNGMLLDATQVGSLFGVDRRALLRWLKRGGFPKPAFEFKLKQYSRLRPVRTVRLWRRELIEAFIPGDGPSPSEVIVEMSKNVDVIIEVLGGVHLSGAQLQMLASTLAHSQRISQPYVDATAQLNAMKT